MVLQNLGAQGSHRTSRTVGTEGRKGPPTFPPSPGPGADPLISLFMTLLQGSGKCKEVGEGRTKGISLIRERGWSQAPQRPVWSAGTHPVFKGTSLPRDMPTPAESSRCPDLRSPATGILRSPLGSFVETTATDSVNNSIYTLFPMVSFGSRN